MLPLAARAQDKTQVRFSAMFSEQGIRTHMMQRMAKALGENHEFELFYGGNLFKQGTELVALRRGNLEMGHIAPQGIAKQIPA